MNKKKLLSEIQQALASGAISIEDLEKLSATQATPSKQTSLFIMLFYYLGAAIIFLGLLIFISERWSGMSSLTRLCIANGVPFIAYFSAIILVDDPKWSMLSVPFFVLFVLFLPFAFYTSFVEAYYRVVWMEQIIFGLCFLACWWVFLLYRQNLLLSFTFFYGTLLFCSIIAHSVYSVPLPWKEQYALGSLFLLSGCYTILGRSFWITTRTRFAKTLGRLGFLGMLITAIFLKYDALPIHQLWEAVLLVTIAADFYLAVRSRDAFLMILGALFLSIDIICITNQYFVRNIGWPLSLLFMGMSLIIIASVSWYLYKSGEKI